MRPTGGTLVCIACTQRAKARTVLAGGRRISLGQGQRGLMLPEAAAAAAPAARGGDAPLTPVAPRWKPPAPGAASPHERLGLFPHDAIRDGQVRFARDVKLAVQAGRHLVAHAPTGIGKTAAALAPALEEALASGKTVMFLTNRQSQHKVAVDTLRLIQERRGVRFTLVDLVAKRNMCLRPEAAELHPARFGEFCARETRNHSCTYLQGGVDRGALEAVAAGVLHVEELMKVGADRSTCPHLLAVTAAQDAQVVVADYNHLFSDLREQSLERLGLHAKDLILVVDEAHNLPDRIRSEHSHKLTPFLLDLVESEARATKASAVRADLAALRDALVRLADEAKASGKARPSRTGGGTAYVAQLDANALPVAFEAERNRLAIGTIRTLVNLKDDLAAVAKAIRKEGDGEVQAEELMAILDGWGRFGDAALRYVEWDEAGGAVLNLRLLDPSIPAKTVFASVHSAVLMSGTLRPPEMARDLLGLEAARTTTRVYASPFPPEHRLTVVAQGVSTRYEDRSAGLWESLGSLVRTLAAATRGNLAVFTPSYAILREAEAQLAGDGLGKEVVVEDPQWGKAERDRVLDQMAGARRRGGAVLLGVLGGSFAEGIDFRDNLLSCVVVVGVPLAPPDLEVDAAIAYLETRYPGSGRLYAYTVPAMNRVLQATGRGIRSATDKCAVVLWDERFAYPPYRALLGDLPVHATRDPAGLVVPFLRGHGL